MEFDGSALRQASDAPHLPFRARHVTLVRIQPDGVISQAKGVEEKRAMLKALDDADCILAAWTGQYSTDVFFVDDRRALTEGIG